MAGCISHRKQEANGENLFILKQEADPVIQAIMTESKRDAETIVVDLRGNQDYEEIVDHIETCDKVITW